MARIKAETTPFEFVGDVGDVMLYHHNMVHSTGINTSETIRMSCIQDFTRAKPRRNIMWHIEGGSHTPDGRVTFDKAVPHKDDGDRCAEGVLFYVLSLTLGCSHVTGSVVYCGTTIQSSGVRRNQLLTTCGLPGTSEQYQQEDTS